MQKMLEDDDVGKFESDENKVCVEIWFESGGELEKRVSVFTGWECSLSCKFKDSDESEPNDVNGGLLAIAINDWDVWSFEPWRGSSEKHAGRFHERGKGCLWSRDKLKFERVNWRDSELETFSSALIVETFRIFDDVSIFNIFISNRSWSFENSLASSDL